MLIEVLKYIGGTAVALAALAWFAKSMFLHWMSKDLANHRTRLEMQQQNFLESIRADVAFATIEHEIRYRSSYEKVAEYLVEIYRRLQRLFDATRSYVAILEQVGEPSKDEKLSAVIASNKEFWDYLIANRLYVPPDLYQRIRRVGDLLVDLVREFQRGQYKDEMGIQQAKQGEDYWTKCINSVDNEISPLFTAMVAEVQSLLGIPEMLSRKMSVASTTVSFQRHSP
ncbi:MAG: hypothetical protein WD851_15740 [Pirellulales bacterium]